MGKANLLKAMDRFHPTHQDVSVELNVTCHPYSFVGDKPIAKGAELKETWADRYMGSQGDRTQKLQTASRMLNELGSASSTTFDINVKGAHDRDNFYVDSQRLVLWAGRHGKQEAVMSELNALHFSRAQSAGERATLMAAAAAAGLDPAETSAFLDGDELRGRRVGELQIDDPREAYPLDPALRVQRAVDRRGGRPLPRRGARRATSCAAAATSSPSRRSSS